jgi:hypothetical protein
MVESIIEKFPDAKNAVFDLLKQIESGIPLNSMYIDMTNDEKIVNETSTDEGETVTLLKLMLSQYSEDTREAIFKNLQNVEPFCNYSEAIQKVYNEGI